LAQKRSGRLPAPELSLRWPRLQALRNARSQTVQRHLWTTRSQYAGDSQACPQGVENAGETSSPWEKAFPTRRAPGSGQALAPNAGRGRRAAGRAPGRWRTPRGFADCGTSLPIFDGRAFSHNVLIGRSAAVRSFRRTFRGVAVGKTLLANRARSVGRGRPVQGDLLRRHRGLAIPCAALSVEDRVRALRLENERIGSSPTPTTKIAGVIGVPSSRPKTSANPIVAAATTVSSQPIRRSPARFQAVG